MIIYTTGYDDYQTVTYEPGVKLTSVFGTQAKLGAETLKESMKNDILNLGHNKIAVMFSGGMDSEVVMECCSELNSDYYAVFCLYTYKKLPVNVHELYYVDKYCVSKNIPLKILELDIGWFYESDKYLKYVQTYHCNIAQICAYLWFCDQITDTIILGGDAPHITGYNPITYFPPLLGQVAVERMFAMQSRSGIPNALTYTRETLDLCLSLWQQHTDEPTAVGERGYTRWAYTKRKHHMYISGGFTLEVKPKFSSPFALCADFDIRKYDQYAAKVVPNVYSTVLLVNHQYR